MEIEVRKIVGERLLVMGGVYSNYEALQALKAWADTNNYTADSIVCTGDVVAYCADAKACVDLVADWGIHCIAGNVEIQLRNREEDCGCNFMENSSCDLHSQRWYPYAQAQITEKHLQWMNTLPEQLILEFGGEKWGVCHGAPSETSRFVYLSSPWEEKQKELNYLDVQKMIAGHCGVPFLDQNASNAWVNSGALGMPGNDGTQDVWFAAIDKNREGFEVKFHRLSYDWRSTQEKMRNANLPEVYAKTLETGLWDSTEVLRPEEVQQTGTRLTLDESPTLLKATKSVLG
jgi:predicted phosphodiesterase